MCCCVCDALSALTHRLCRGAGAAAREEPAAAFASFIPVVFTSLSKCAPQDHARCHHCTLITWHDSHCVALPSSAAVNGTAAAPVVSAFAGAAQAFSPALTQSLLESLMQGA
jgi:hypothetical protein